MPEDLFTFTDKPEASYLLAGWRRQWSNGGRISSGLPRYLIEKNGGRQVGQFSEYVNRMCYPFQVAGTHDAFRPSAAFNEGLPSVAMSRQNSFYEVGSGLVVFLGEEPWYRLDIYAEAFFSAIQELGVQQTVAVEGVNGPAPPDLERRITCVYSRPEMREQLERHGVQFSSYGSRGRQGPTIGMALVSVAHYQYPEVQMFRMGAMAPMYPFMTSNNNQLGITQDHRAYYDILRRLRSIFKIEMDLSELEQMGNRESQELLDNLERLGRTNSEAKQIIDQVRLDYQYTPYVEPVDLDPALDQALENILRDIGEPGQET
ncbi:MAG: PAC2 family protein [Chloroflexota bacterium]|nr:PAC2 family protein [Chloroflexota bacterium]MDE2959164.1 PAC2 family protein [Chloroflexota bacterium]